MKIPNPYQDYPQEWATFDFHAGRSCPHELNLAGTIGDVNRFGARFRLAKAFTSLNLDGYSEPTASGYSALCRVLLTWSAFEQFMTAIGVEQRDLATLLAKYDTVKLQHDIRVIDTEDRFYQFVHARVNATHQGELSNYFNADPCNITYLASAIRHIFAHRSLTPNANQVDPCVVTGVCNKLSAVLLYIMDTEFSARITAFVKSVYGPEYAG